MEKREQLELVEVTYKNDGKKAVLGFIDADNGFLLEVNFNKQSFDESKNEYIDDEEKAEKVEEWSQEYFGTSFDKLTNCIGEKRDVYAYDSFNSLWESDFPQKFNLDDQGKLFQTTIKDIKDDGIKIRIMFEDQEGVLRESKMTYADYVESMKKWFVNPQKQNKQYKKFESKFGVSVAEAETIIGKEIMVEVKVAFKKHAYAEIKKPNWA